jgi:hypothetical protein
MLPSLRIALLGSRRDIWLVRTGAQCAHNQVRGLLPEVSALGAR